MAHRKKHEHADAPEAAEQELEQNPEGEPREEEPNPLQAALEDALIRIHQLEGELETAKEDVMRATAEVQNVKRRTEQEKRQTRQMATRDLVEALLPVLDNFERTVAHLQNAPDPQKILNGISAVEKQLRLVLESQNLRRIQAVGQPFDPELHEAIGMEASDEYPSETVIAEVEPGYMMGDKVIRPARVKVAG
jgi:molecular chaperone GrpE